MDFICPVIKDGTVYYSMVNEENGEYITGLYEKNQEEAVVFQEISSTLYDAVNKAEEIVREHSWLQDEDTEELIKLMEELCIK